MTDQRIVDIIATGATMEELEIALAWAAGESDVMGKERHPLSGAAERVYAILMAGQEFPNENAAPRS
jgi:hypothetical protein